MDEEIEALIEAMRKQKQDYFLPPEWDGKVVFLKNTKSGTRLDLFAGMVSSKPHAFTPTNHD